MRSMVEGICAMLAGPPKTVKQARRSRREMSVPEVMLWVRLRLRPAGIKFRRQHPAGPYVLDFSCSEARLAIEVDGISHDMGRRPEQDEARTAWLAANKIGVLRIAASDVLTGAGHSVEQIVAACHARGNPLHRPSGGPPPRSGEENYA